MRVDENATPLGALLNDDCLGCHTGTTGRLGGFGGAPLVNIPTGGTDPANNAAVLAYLPGGYFNSGADSISDAKMHNIDMDNPDNIFSNNAPPGYVDMDGEGGLPSDDAGWTSQLTCAGNFGCHGDHTQPDQAKAISGEHHTDTANYRMLNGIQGKEDRAYTIALNIYAADNTDGQTRSISYLCGECHGDFHNADDVTDIADTYVNAWVRHPTDLAMTDALGSGDVYTDYDYDIEAPSGQKLADQAAYDLATTQASGEFAYVTCLSCHFAHGGNNDDLLRWTYDGMQAGQTDATLKGTGCFRCHTNKDAPDA